MYEEIPPSYGRPVGFPLVLRSFVDYSDRYILTWYDKRSSATFLRVFWLSSRFPFALSRPHLVRFRFSLFALVAAACVRAHFDTVLFCLSSGPRLARVQPCGSVHERAGHRPQPDEGRLLAPFPDRRARKGPEEQAVRAAASASAHHAREGARESARRHGCFDCSLWERGCCFGVCCWWC